MDDPPLTKQNGGLREIFAPVHNPKKNVRGGGGGGGGVWLKWKQRMEKCVFATANSQLSNVNYGF